VSDGVLILGTNIAALQATMDLADSGVKVNLVEAAPFMNMNDSSETPVHLLNTRMLEIIRHPNVTIWTNTRLNRYAGEAGNFKVELRQHPRFVDLNLCTACGACLEVCPVTVPGTSHKVIYIDGQPGIMAIDKLGKPPCSNTCPGGIHVQGYVALIAQARFQEAIDLIRNAIPFPGICGRVCTHPCEINCRRTEIDAPVAVRLLKRFVADWEVEQGRDGTKGPGRRGAAHSLRPTTHHSHRVAIVGAGPGGMAVADRLVRQGYPVTVFEKLPVIGGMMAIGIPGYRLPREIITREYQRIQDLGVEIKLNTAIGPKGKHTLDDLFEMGYAAVCLAVGAHRSLNLGIPGEDLHGVVHGIDVLKTISLIHQQDDLQYEVNLLNVLRKGTKTRIAVLGGGNTAIDVARSLKRYNVDDVTIFYRRTRAEMPAMDVEIEDAKKEGIAYEFLVSPMRVLGAEVTGVTGLECIRTKLGEPDPSGRRRPVPIADSEFVVDLDLVILAIGQTPDLDFLDPDHGIAITRSQRINVAEVNFMTSRAGVFAVGDAVTRDNMVVIEAIGMGKKAAVAIDAYLQGQPPNEIVVDARQMPIARREMSESELVTKPRVAVPTIPLEKRITSYAEVELGYSADQAIAEAQRCLACGPCSECQACVQVCKPGAILHDQRETYTHLDVGAIIYADGSQHTKFKSGNNGVYQIPTNEALSGSAVAIQVYSNLEGVEILEVEKNQRFSAALSKSPNQTNLPGRLGVFICQCGPDVQGEISRVIDTNLIQSQAATWPGVVHTQALAFSCSSKGVKAIDAATETHNLDRIILAACSCCSIDQVCYSCTYQRVRCKDSLKLYSHLETPNPLSPRHPAAKIELVNIREQCAWVHGNDPKAATVKATALIAGTVNVARLRIGLNYAGDSYSIASVVDASRCRACGTCVGICAFGAPELILENDQHHSWIDPTICQGCGTCVAHCPSGAITAGYSTDVQIEAMLSAILAR
jgi:NADPH-dependent glutamate synthase beta subunit-like oxidoreductase/formate hydrogenlyase subunit 6/NADH:ubiquinone oxidoreductase subunit I